MKMPGLTPTLLLNPRPQAKAWRAVYLKKKKKKMEEPPGFLPSWRDPISKSRSSCGIQSNLLKASQVTFQLDYNVTRLGIKIPEREVKMRAE